jgi:DNA-directed RNA polymerase subunit RPC12/RpoP
MTPRLSVALASARCVIFGHRVHHTRVSSEAHTPCVRCGKPILDQGNAVSHVSHTLSCFFGRHHYVRVARRKGHHEYVCEKCGHPLLFELFRDPYSSRGKFAKRVSYACGLLGHRVHVVTTDQTFTEYACVCGHSFIKAERGMTVIRHPLACVVRGHFIAAHQVRGEWAEYVCRRCGHPFSFRLAGSARRESNREQRAHG